MNDFETRIQIDAAADDVFSFVTDFSHMQEFLPSVKKMTPIDDGHVRLEGEMYGKAYEAVGWFQIHPFNRTMLWGDTKAKEYNGDLEVIEDGDSCQLVIHLKFQEVTDKPEAGSKPGSHVRKIQESLDESAKKIKSECERAFVAAKNRRGYLS